MTTATGNFMVHTPGQLLANIPGALGFYPTESLVLMGFHGEDSVFTLGPTVRIDIDDIHECLPEVTDTLYDIGCRMVFGFLISTRPEHLIDSIMTGLYYHRRLRAGLEIRACWHVSEVRTGEEYAIWFGPEAPAAGQEVFGGEGWDTGRVPPITGAATMVDYVRKGALPDLNREEALRPLRDSNPHFTLNELAVLERVATGTATDLHLGAGLRAADGGGRAYTRAMVSEDAEWLLGEAADQTFDEIRADDELLMTVGAWMSTVCMRDAVMGVFLSTPEVAGDVLLAVAQSFSGAARANALCVYAAVLIEQRFAMKTGAVLTTVLEENPDHSLASLMLQAYRAGLHEWLVQSLKEGSELTRASISEAERPADPASETDDEWDETGDWDDDWEDDEWKEGDWEDWDSDGQAPAA